MNAFERDIGRLSKQLEAKFIVISKGNGRVISLPLLVRVKEIVVDALVVSLIEVIRMWSGCEFLFTVENVEFAFHL